MFKYILKQLRRSIVTNALFCLLLTLSGTLLCLTAGLWYSAYKAYTDIDDLITTIATPDLRAINRRAMETVVITEDDDHESIAEKFQAAVEYEAELLRIIREEIYPSGRLSLDNRRFFNAIAEGISPMKLNTVGFGPEQIIAMHSGQSTAAFIVTYERSDVHYYVVDNRFGFQQDDFQTSEDPFVYRYSMARFVIDETLHLIHDHTFASYLDISFVNNFDGSSLFEYGKQYAVIGYYQRSYGASYLSVLELPDAEMDYKIFGYINSNDELNNLTGGLHWYNYYFDNNYFPMPVKEYTFVRELLPEDGWYSFVEITGSVEETINSDAWKQMEDAITAAKMSAASFQIITTDDPNSLLRFNQNRNLFDEGRSFTADEINRGAKVCLVSRQFADENELTVGDVMPVQFYASVLGSLTETYAISELGHTATNKFWIPSTYNPELELSEPYEYTIVGIFNTLRLDTSEYAIMPNTVIIPDTSFAGISGEPVSRFDTSLPPPVLVDAVIVPNGKIEETRALIDEIVPDFAGLFRFYDQGYDSLRLALGNLQFAMSWILALAVAGWVAVLLIFLMFYVSRKRKDAALLYAISVSRFKRTVWIFAQCVILTLVALGISIAASLPVYGDIIDIAGGTAQEFTDSFRDLTLSDAADAGLRTSIPLSESPYALIITVAVASFVTLISAAFISSRAADFKSLAEKGEEN